MPTLESRLNQIVGATNLLRSMFDPSPRTQLAGDPRVVLACGADEGLDHPEPIAGIRQDTDRLVAALSAELSHRPVVIIDELDHHRGLPVRLRALLERWA